ncbi:MAG: magnesium transporter, partial [Flavobacteriia bacterium]|nr:magnesium transporter [Flavobacteriia bacterium]
MATFQIDKSFLAKVESLIEQGKDKALQKLLNNLHYADIAEVLSELEAEASTYLIKLLDSTKTAEALAEIDEDLRETILKNLSAKEIADEIEELDSDDAADLIAELPEERKERVISQLSDSSYAEDLRELLTYGENTAGGLMAKELVKVEEDLSVLKCLNRMRAQAENVTRVHSIYVVDTKNRLKGRLSLKDLITANSKALVKDICIP